MTTPFPLWYQNTAPQEPRRNTIDLRICTLASGSKGNCILIEGGNTKILVDAGLSFKETKARLDRVGVSPEEISAVIITHEHIDHVKGIGPLGRALKIPIYMTPKTRKAAEYFTGKDIIHEEFEAGRSFEIHDIHIEPFSTPHDAVDSVGFTFHCGSHKGGLATDLGYATHLVIERLKGCNILVLESNHDPVMLKDGPYPWHLKQRVAGKHGHLSNADSSRLLVDVLHPGLSSIILAHLSETNNTPDIAFKMAQKTLKESNCTEITLGLAWQGEVSGFFGV